MKINSTRVTSHSKIALLFFVLLIAAPTSFAQTRSSVYTDLDAKKCRTLKLSSAEGGEYQGRCKGIAGYTLLVTEGDLRQNIEVVTPSGAKHSLDLWSVVSSAFSSLGPKAEWRVAKVKGKLSPVALIVRYNASENPEDSTKITSYLAVAKITSSSICVTDKISPGPNANAEARTAADVSASKPCLKSP